MITMGWERYGAAEKQLHSVRVINRILYLNGDPAKNHLLPLWNAWKVNDLAEEILRACADYDMVINWHGALFLARKLAEQVVNETVQGGLELGWD